MSVGGQGDDPAAFYTRERPGTHWMWGWLCRKAGLDDMLHSKLKIDLNCLEMDF
jgi:hypothetical protein